MGRRGPILTVRTTLALRGFVWVAASAKTSTWQRRSRRACFSYQARDGHRGGAAGTPWRLGCSCHPTQLASQLASQQCTQMPQNGAERPDPPICVHYCDPKATHNPSSRRNSVHKCPKTAPRGHFRRSVYTPASPRPLARPGGATGRSGFKLFCVDVGLLGALAGLDPSVALGGSSPFTEFKGAMTEQYVAQELFGLGLLPVYWSSSTGSAEVDFAIDHGAGALPIEVKAHENLRAKSLRAACEKFELSRAVRTSLSPYRDEGWLVNIPLWALGQVERLA